MGKNKRRNNNTQSATAEEPVKETVNQTQESDLDNASTTTDPMLSMSVVTDKTETHDDDNHNFQTYNIQQEDQLIEVPFETSIEENKNGMHSEEDVSIESIPLITHPDGTTQAKEADNLDPEVEPA